MDKATSTGTSDDSNEISATAPYIVEVTIEGTAPVIFHRWQDSSVAEKAAAAKGSKAKKTDDVESYLWRDTEGRICLPGVYLVASMTDPKNGAAKYRQDPRSPRKSALDLYKAGVIPLTDLAPITKVTGEVAHTWDYLDSRRAVVQRNGITRVRPTLLAGWRATVEITVLTPEYIPPSALLDCLVMAGRLVGVADHRPTFGRFSVPKFEVVELI